MLKLSMLEFFFRVIPEVFFFILAAYTFSGIRVDKKRYFYSSITLGIIVFIVRLLPIDYGVHTIVNIIALTIIVSLVNNIDIVKAIRSSIITAITLFICEGINILLLTSILNMDLEPIMGDKVLKTFYSMPSLLCFAVIVVARYCHLWKRGKLKDA